MVEMEVATVEAEVAMVVEMAVVVQVVVMVQG